MKHTNPKSPHPNQNTELFRAGTSQVPSKLSQTCEQMLVSSGVLYCFDQDYGEHKMKDHNMNPFPSPLNLTSVFRNCTALHPLSCKVMPPLLGFLGR